MSALRSPLHAVHDERGARFTEFGGWDMPVSFESIRTEHTAVRSDRGIFDVSHMGEIDVTGPDARELCQRLLTNDVDALAVGDAQYTTVTTEAGLLLDDTIIYRLEDDHYRFIPNAGKHTSMVERWESHREDWSLTATITDRTHDFAMLAVQGPTAIEHVDGHVAPTICELDPMTIARVTITGVDGWCATTGYTGERGVELLVPWDDAETVDAALEGTRCGLGARDTLRLEMGFVLAGNEFDPEHEPRTPIEAGLSFVVDLDAEPAFVGRDALAEQAATGSDERLVGIRMLDRGIPRSGYTITDGDGAELGHITSGTMSPTLGEAIGLGYVSADRADEGETVHVRIRDADRKARIVTPPFLEADDE